jgi:DNA-binding transcriptional LysR family regulator
MSCMSARLPRWDDLEIFLATARGGTLAAAARALGVNSSTIHRRVAALESDLNTRLFNRSQRGYELTAVGEDLLTHAASLEEQVLALSRKITGRDQTLEGLIRVSTVDDLANEVLTPIFQGFLAKHPQVRLEVTVVEIFADLARRQADVAIRFGGKPSKGDVVAKHVTKVAVGLYAGTSYLQNHDRITSVDDLARHMIVRGDQNFAAMPMEKLLDRHCKESQFVFRSGSMLTRQSAIRAGIGVGFLSRFMGDKDPSLVAMDIDTPDLSAELWLLVHADLRRNARVRAFVDHTHAELCKLVPSFQGQ